MTIFLLISNKLNFKLIPSLKRLHFLTDYAHYYIFNTSFSRFFAWQVYLLNDNIQL